MRHFTAFAVLFAAICTSCDKQGGSGEGGTATDITTTFIDEKSSLPQENLLWSAGKSASVFDEVSNNNFTAKGAGKSTTFSGKAKVITKYAVLYPYDKGASYRGGYLRTSIMPSQTAVAGGVCEGANLIVGIANYNKTYRAQMMNVGCFFKFTVGDSGSGISKVEISAVGEEKLSGPVSISFDENGIPSTIATTGSTAKVSISPASGQFKAGTYYIVARPSTLTFGLSVTVSKGSQTIEYGFKGIPEIARNGVYTLEGNIDEKITALVNEDNKTERYEESGPVWNKWSDAASLRESLLRAREYGKVYFSQFKFYDYEKTGELTPYKSLDHPLIYSLDFYKGSGEYYPEADRKPIRANTISIVKKAWKEHRAICSFSWHLESPYAVYNDFYLRQGTGMGCRYLDQTHVESGGSRWVDNFPPEHRYQVREILENKEVHYVNEYVNPQTGKTERFERTFKLGDWFDERCQDVANMINEMVDENGRPIPILFRLWHELEDRWAWWQIYYFNTNRQNCTVDDYKALWARTVDNFRRMCPNAQMLFVYCMDRNFDNEGTYMTAYPGDEYVDIMGYDDYYIGTPEKFGSDQATIDALLTRSRVVSKLAREHGKLSMVCETNNRSEDSSVQRRFYRDFVMAMLNDPETTHSIFQIWSSPGNSAAKLEALQEFLKEDKVIIYK